MAKSSVGASRDATNAPLLNRSARTGAGNAVLASRSLNSFSDSSLLRHRLHETQTQTCRRCFAVHELQFESLHAAATLREKSAELIEQGGEGRIEACRVPDLGLDVASGHEPRARDEILARVRSTPDCAIEHVEHL